MCPDPPNALAGAFHPLAGNLFFLRSLYAMSRSAGIEVVSAGSTTHLLEISDGLWCARYEMTTGDFGIGLDAIAIPSSPFGTSLGASLSGTGEWGWFRTAATRTVSDFHGSPVRVESSTGRGTEVTMALEPARLVHWPSFPMGSGVSTSVAGWSTGRGYLTRVRRPEQDGSPSATELRRLHEGARQYRNYLTYGNGSYWMPRTGSTPLGVPGRRGTPVMRAVR